MTRNAWLPGRRSGHPLIKPRSSAVHGSFELLTRMLEFAAIPEEAFDPVAALADKNVETPAERVERKLIAHKQAMAMDRVPHRTPLRTTSTCERGDTDGHSPSG
jgi:hypothetical protein